VRAGNPESDSEEELLLQALSIHNQKEERVLYPAIDQMLNVEERSNIFTSMAELPEERYDRCCHGHEKHADVH